MNEGERESQGGREGGEGGEKVSFTGARRDK